MAGCCNPRGCDKFFTPRFARRMATRYRKRGLDQTARRMVEFLEQRGIEGATVLEIGGGVGEIQIELLKRGAARSVNLELSRRTTRRRSGSARGGTRGPCRAAPPRHRGRARRHRVSRHRRLAPGRLLLSGLRAPAGRGGSARWALARVQLSAAQRCVARFHQCGKPRLQAAAEGVSELRPSAGGDARPTWRARASADVRPSQSVWQVAGLER